MYSLHITNKNYSSWSLRPWVLMKTLDIPFAEQLHPFPTSDAWELFRSFAPNGKVPCLEDGATRVWDSLAITEYLAETHQGVWPETRTARTWARCAVAEMHSGFQALRGQCSMSCGVRIQMRTINPGLARDLARIDELWREGLSRFGGPFLAGAHFCAADAFFAPVAFRIQTYELPISANAAQYAGRLLNLPAARDWYEAALRETWREPEHEEDVLGAGELLADYRHIA
jgi:glutathione S-transferase